jgi:hypothetical protein
LPFGARVGVDGTPALVDQPFAERLVERPIRDLANEFAVEFDHEALAECCREDGTGTEQQLDMLFPRVSHAAVKLGDGRVLVIVGLSYGGFLLSTETWDPATGIWTDGASMREARGDFTATVLDEWRPVAQPLRQRSRPLAVLLDSGRASTR